MLNSKKKKKRPTPLCGGRWCCVCLLSYKKTRLCCAVTKEDCCPAVLWWQPVSPLESTNGWFSRLLLSVSACRDCEETQRTLACVWGSWRWPYMALLQRVCCFPECFSLNQPPLLESGVCLELQTFSNLVVLDVKRLPAVLFPNDRVSSCQRRHEETKLLLTV